jgi:hypothetical protein
MKKNIILLIFVLSQNFIYGQVLISKNEINIFKGDSLIWLDKYKTLLLCPKNNKRESLFSITTKYTFSLDTIKFGVIESKDESLLGSSQLLFDSDYLSFIDLDIMGSYLHVFKRHKKHFWNKGEWIEDAALSLPPLKSRLSGFHMDMNVNIVERAYLIDIFTVKVIYTNGNEDTYYYDAKLFVFDKKN